MNIISTKAWTFATTITVSVLLGHVRCQNVRIYVDGRLRDDELPEFMKPAGKAGLRMISCQVDYSGYARLQSVTLKKSAEGTGRMQRPVNMVVATMGGLSGVFSGLPERYSSEYIVVSSRAARLNVYIDIQQPSDAGTFYCEATFQVGSQATTDRSQSREFFPSGGFYMVSPSTDKEGLSASAKTIIAIAACVAIGAVVITIIFTCLFLSKKRANQRTASRMFGRPSQMTTNRKASYMTAFQNGRKNSQVSAIRSRAAVGSRPSLVYSRKSRKPSVFAPTIDEIRMGRVASGIDRTRKASIGQNKVVMSAAELQRSDAVSKDMRTVPTRNDARNSVLMAEAARHIAAYPPVSRQSLTFPSRGFPAKKAESNAQHQAAIDDIVHEDITIRHREKEKEGAGATAAAGGLSKVRGRPANKYPNDGLYDGRVNKEYYDDYRV